MYSEICHDFQFKLKVLPALCFLSKDLVFYTLSNRSLLVEILSFRSRKSLGILILSCVHDLASFSSGVYSSILLLRKAQGGKACAHKGAFYFSGVSMDIFSHIFWLGFTLGRDSQCSIWHLKDYTINLAGVSLHLFQWWPLFAGVLHKYPSYCLISAGRPGGQLSLLTWFWSPQEQRKRHVFFWLILPEAELNVQCVFNKFWQWYILQLLLCGGHRREHHC